MNFYINAFYSFTIFIAGIIGVIRFKKIYYAYYPFLLCIGIACIVELLNVIIAINHRPSVIYVNMYVLAESLLITLLFKNLGIFKKTKKLFIAIIAALIIFWLLENLANRDINKIDAYFRVFYSFIIVLMSVTSINKIISGNRKINATFLLCIGFIIYFTFKILVFSFWLSGFSNGFLSKIFTIMIYINLLTNLIYAIAVLWMPRKQEFTLPY